MWCDHWKLFFIKPNYKIFKTQKFKMIFKIRVVFAQIVCCMYLSMAVESLREKVPCIDNGKFYRNPNREAAHVWSATICAKYYLCIENEIFSFTCSTGLNFDVNRQICDFKVIYDIIYIWCNYIPSANVHISTSFILQIVIVGRCS